MTWDISDIYIFKPFFLSNLIGLFQCPNRSWRKIGQFILGKETVEVKRCIFSQIGPDPDAHLSNLSGVVIQRGNNKIDDLEMPSIRFDRP